MECLNVQRASDFVSFALENDLQIAINRRTGLQRIRDALAKTGDPAHSCFEWPVESYEKMETFLSQNDAQVHYSGTNTVAVYSMVKLLGSLRRALRDMSSPSAVFRGGVLASPTRLGTQPAPLSSPVRSLTFSQQGGATPTTQRRNDPPTTSGGLGPLGAAAEKTQYERA